MHSCNKAELRRFKARAGHRHPAEYVETLWGLKAGRAYDIHAIRPSQHRGTRSSCSVDQNGWEQYLETTAVETGMEFLGTIHTHIDELHYPEPSHHDNLDAIECGERIFAIDSIKSLPSGRKKHTVKFWFPQAPVENIKLV